MAKKKSIRTELEIQCHEIIKKKYKDMIVVAEGVANGINHHPKNKIFPSIPVHLEDNKIKEIINEKRWCYLPDIVAIK